MARHRRRFARRQAAVGDDAHPLLALFPPVTGRACAATRCRVAEGRGRAGGGSRGEREKRRQSANRKRRADACGKKHPTAAFSSVGPPCHCAINESRIQNVSSTRFQNRINHLPLFPSFFFPSSSQPTAPPKPPSSRAARAPRCAPSSSTRATAPSTARRRRATSCAARRTSCCRAARSPTRAARRRARS